MDLTLTTNIATASDPETETLAPKPLSYATGPPEHRPRPYRAPPVYRECLRNHAAPIGGHALDGCCEFMPSYDELKCAPSDCPVLTCAACGCHRNFHRREEGKVTSPEPSCYPKRPPDIPRLSPESSPSPPPHYPAPHTQMLLALSTVVGKEQINVAPVATPATPKGENGNPRERKRFRTKFTKEQKDAMFAFSEKLGWKMPRADDVVVRAFCDKIRVTRGVLKVWMHNNKHTFAKRDANFAINGPNLSNISNGISANDVNNHQNESNNGSSSSA